MDSIIENLKSIIANQLGCEPKEIGLMDTLQILGFDSLDKTDLILTCEEAFGIEIPEEDVAAIRSVAGLYDAILRASGLLTHQPC